MAIIVVDYLPLMIVIGPNAAHDLRTSEDDTSARFMRAFLRGGPSVPDVRQGGAPVDVVTPTAPDRR